MQALKNLGRSIYVLIAISLLGGCASMEMQKVALISAPQPNMALVTFVRPAIFFGDGVSFDIWDGEHVIGALGPGTMIQHEAQPGEHLFLANAENWSYTSANLLPGKHYFIKANIFPGIGFARVALGAVPKTDARIEEWLTKLDPKVARLADKQALEAKKQTENRTAIQEFKDGKVTSFSELRAEDGR